MDARFTAPPDLRAKNAALPLMIASLLTEDELTLANVPRLSDVSNLARILGNHGVDVTIAGKRNGDEVLTARPCASTPLIVDTTAPYELVSTMRASFWVIAPLLARMGRAKVSLPGGCAIGHAPVDLLLMALERLGAKIDIDAGYAVVSADKGLKGARDRFPEGDGRRHPCGADGRLAGRRHDGDPQRRARAERSSTSPTASSRGARGSRAMARRPSR